PYEPTPQPRTARLPLLASRRSFVATVIVLGVASLLAIGHQHRRYNASLPPSRTESGRADFRVESPYPEVVLPAKALAGTSCMSNASSPTRPATRTAGSATRAGLRNDRTS